MAVTIFSSVADALLANVKTVQLFVFVEGVAVDVQEYHGSHDTEQPVGTGSLVLSAPVPEQVAFNATVEVQAGYAGAVRRVFHGRIPAYDGAIEERGVSARILLEGWASLLTFTDFADLSWPGPISLKELFRAICERRGVPLFLADDTTYPDGTTTIMLGGNADVDEGKIIVPRRQTPLSLLERLSRLFGYRVFDTPAGVFRLQRVSGLPDGSAVATYAEGVNAYRFAWRASTVPMVTYWEVNGARYTAADGTDVEIRSIPAAVPYSAELDPPGYRRDEFSDQALISQGLADAVREVLEIDRGAPQRIQSWEVDGDPERQPGDIVTVQSATADEAGLRWLMNINRDVTERGFYDRMEGWSGNGAALAAGADCVSELLHGPGGGLHLGDETISWYRTPAPHGTSWTLAFTPATSYSSISVSAYAHGCNSFFVGGMNSASTVSRLEIWQGSLLIGKADLPVLDENYALQRPYSDDQYWTAVEVAIPGRVEAGAAELRIVAGSNAAASFAPIDDFEIRDVTLRLCGAGGITAPGEGSL
jgi:hypothetical protein